MKATQTETPIHIYFIGETNIFAYRRETEFLRRLAEINAGRIGYTDVPHVNICSMIGSVLDGSQLEHLFSRLPAADVYAQLALQAESFLQGSPILRELPMLGHDSMIYTAFRRFDESYCIRLCCSWRQGEVVSCPDLKQICQDALSRFPSLQLSYEQDRISSTSIYYHLVGPCDRN